ncbi:MAG TPA: phosphorylase [Acidobacteriaceae bacterium]|jgi:adenosylhomocysteine nucleosidase
MSSTVAILAALPREIAGLVRGVRADEELRKRGVSLYRLSGAVVAAAGMGAERVPFAIEAALASGGVTTLVSVGLAGSCMPELAAGAVAEASVVVDVRTSEKFRTDMPEPSGQSVVLATTEAIASVQEKARLSASYGAAMVDMEAAVVARLAQAHGLKFRAIKGISDAHDFELASLSQFSGKHGSFRTGAFALHTALRPGNWPKAMRLGRESSRAVTALEQRLRTVIHEDQK